MLNVEFAWPGFKDVERVAVYASQSQTPREVNYATTEREAFAINY